MGEADRYTVHSTPVCVWGGGERSDGEALVSGSTEKPPDLTTSPGQTRGPTSRLLLPKTTGGKARCVSAVPLSRTLTNKETEARELC